MSTAHFEKLRYLQLNMKAFTSSNSSPQLFPESSWNPPNQLVFSLPKYIFPKYTYSHNIYFKNIYFQNIYLQNIFFGIFKYSSICLTPVILSLPTLCLGEKGGQARKKFTKRFVFEFSVKTLKSSIKCLKLFGPSWTLSGKNQYFAPKPQGAPWLRCFSI